MIKACIFDLGGTIIDKYSVTPLISLRKAFSNKKINVKPQLIRKDMGLSKREHIQKICDSAIINQQWYKNTNYLLSDKDKEDIFNDFSRIQKRETVENMKVIPHTWKCMQYLKKNNILSGVTTGFDYEQTMIIKSILESNNIHINHYVSSTCLDKPGRPSPHMIYEIMRELKLDDPRRIIKIDDTTVGIQEGLNAGCITVGVARWSVNMNVNDHEEAFLTDKVITDSLNNYSDNYYSFRKKLRNSRDILTKSGAHYVINNLVELENIIEDINNINTPLPKNLMKD